MLSEYHVVAARVTCGNPFRFWMDRIMEIEIGERKGREGFDRVVQKCIRRLGCSVRAPRRLSHVVPARFTKKKFNFVLVFELRVEDCMRYWQTDSCITSWTGSWGMSTVTTPSLGKFSQVTSRWIPTVQKPLDNVQVLVEELKQTTKRERETV